MAGATTLPTVWAASAVAGWAVWRGAGAGLTAALAVSITDMVISQRWGGATLHNNILMIILGTVIGYCAQLFTSSQLALRAALARDAATEERERLAREIHDSVLQVLAFMRRRGHELGGPAQELAQLAAEQEQQLRKVLMPVPQTDPCQLELDVRGLLAAFERPGCTVICGADPVLLPTQAAELLAAAVGSALANVTEHAGPTAQAWVLLDDEGTHLSVTVRDNGCGFPPGRLAQAHTEGRLGVTASVGSRVAQLGGTSSIFSTPGEGTEVTLRVPRTVRV